MPYSIIILCVYSIKVIELLYLYDKKRKPYDQLMLKLTSENGGFSTSKVLLSFIFR